MVGGEGRRGEVHLPPRQGEFNFLQGLDTEQGKVGG